MLEKPANTRCQHCPTGSRQRRYDDRDYYVDTDLDSYSDGCDDNCASASDQTKLQTKERKSAHANGAEIIFLEPRDVNPANGELTELGFDCEVLHWDDPLSEATWILARADSELDISEFFGWEGRSSTGSAAMSWRPAPATPRSISNSNIGTTSGSPMIDRLIYAATAIALAVFVVLDPRFAVNLSRAIALYREATGR